MLAAGAAFYWMKDTPEIKNLNNSGVSIVAFGDSLTAGKGAPKGSSYPDVLAQKLGREVINMGVSGETAVQAPARLPQVLAQNPYMVLIEFGGNDFMRQQRMEDAAEAAASLEAEVLPASLGAADAAAGSARKRHTGSQKRILRIFPVGKS